MEKKKNKLNIILTVLIFILAILIIAELTTSLVSQGFNSFKHFLFRTVGLEAKEGNTPGNINNYGYMAEDKDYLYFMCPNEDGQFVGISKVSKKDITGKQTRLIEGTWEISSINSYGDYIYFISLSQNQVDENDENADEVDNKIHRVRKNGDQVDEIINDNEFHNYDYKMTVVDGKVYYIGEDECIWYMDLNGNHKTRLNENASGFEAVTDKYILYNMPIFKNGEESSVSYIMDRNGKNAKQLNGNRIFTPVIYKNQIYYLTEDRYLHRMDIDGKNDVMLSDAKIYNLNVSENGIYYINYIYTLETNEVEGLAIFRMDLDGKNNKKIYTFIDESNSICVTDDWVFCLDSDDDTGYMKLISYDGKQVNDLFKLDYANYYYLDELLQEQQNEENDETGDAEEVPEEGTSDTTEDTSNNVDQT